MALTLKLKDFNGPLDMLLFMIGKAKIDIKDIFVSEVTNQYIRSVREADDMDMDEASSFIQMAATLLEIKSRSLLPKPAPPEGEEEDPQAVLIRQLEEYARFKQIASDMQGFEKAAALMYEKLPEEYPLPPPSFEISGLTLSGLISAFTAVMARTPKEEEPPADIARQIMREEHSVPDCMLRIGKLLKLGSIGFSALIGERPSKEEIVTYFLALLELLRLGRISITQDEAYGEILLHPAKRRKQEHGD